MEEITKQTAMNAYNRNFSKGKNAINEGFIRAYKGGKCYTILFKYKEKVGVLLFGTDGDYNRQQMFLDSETFKLLQDIKIETAEILYKGNKK